MVVDDSVVAALQSRSPYQVNVFAAACVERMSQIFTGFRGGDPERSGDGELVMRILDDLWDPRAARDVFVDHLRELDLFPEIASSEEVLEMTEIYCFYSMIALRYAVLGRVDGSVETVVKCAHFVLTAMDQLDQNASGVDYFRKENTYQVEAMSISLDDNFGQSEIDNLRARSRTAGRDIFSFISTNFG